MGVDDVGELVGVGEPVGVEEPVGAATPTAEADGAGPVDAASVCEADEEGPDDEGELRLVSVMISARHTAKTPPAMSAGRVHSGRQGPAGCLSARRPAVHPPGGREPGWGCLVVAAVG